MAWGPLRAGFVVVGWSFICFLIPFVCFELPMAVRKAPWPTRIIQILRKLSIGRTAYTGGGLPPPGTESGRPAQYGQFSRRIGILPVMADGLPACRFSGGQAGCAVFPHRLEACSPIKRAELPVFGGPPTRPMSCQYSAECLISLACYGPWRPESATA